MIVKSRPDNEPEKTMQDFNDRSDKIKVDAKSKTPEDQDDPSNSFEHKQKTIKYIISAVEELKKQESKNPRTNFMDVFEKLTKGSGEFTSGEIIDKLRQSVLEILIEKTPGSPPYEKGPHDDKNWDKRESVKEAYPREEIEKALESRFGITKEMSSSQIMSELEKIK